MMPHFPRRLHLVLPGQLQTVLRDLTVLDQGLDISTTLIGYAETLGNGAVFKRLGFLVSQWFDDDPLVEACRLRLTQGRVAYRSPISPARGDLPRIRFDLTADELLVLPRQN
jgi:hypothetical protein